MFACLLWVVTVEEAARIIYEDGFNQRDKDKKKKNKKKEKKEKEKSSNEIKKKMMMREKSPSSSQSYYSSKYYYTSSKGGGADRLSSSAMRTMVPTFARREFSDEVDTMLRRPDREEFNDQLPIGVEYNEKIRKFSAVPIIDGKRRHVGDFGDVGSAIKAVTKARFPHPSMRWEKRFDLFENPAPMDRELHREIREEGLSQISDLTVNKLGLLKERKGAKKKRKQQSEDGPSQEYIRGAMYRQSELKKKQDRNSMASSQLNDGYDDDGEEEEDVYSSSSPSYISDCSLAEKQRKFRHGFRRELKRKRKMMEEKNGRKYDERSMDDAALSEITTLAKRRKELRERKEANSWQRRRKWGKQQPVPMMRDDMDDRGRKGKLAKEKAQQPPCEGALFPFGRGRCDEFGLPLDEDLYAEERRAQREKMIVNKRLTRNIPLG
eukprot:jgi/Bigna1/132663/aug1.18_g7371